MKASEKLNEVFKEFRPHINGHETAMNIFHDAVSEVVKMEAQLEEAVSLIKNAQNLTAPTAKESFRRFDEYMKNSTNFLKKIN